MINTSYNTNNNINFGSNKAKKESSSLEQPKEDKTSSINLDKQPNACYNKILVNGVSKIGEDKMTKHTKDNYKACLIGGAIGDAVGRPIERVRIDDIKKRYGEQGIQDMATVCGKGRITDDTQMTIFTADGLIKSALKSFDPNKMPDLDMIYDSYQDWYKTQTEGRKNTPEIVQNKGWLGKLPELYYPGGAGRTTLGSLDAGVMGTIENPINNSGSCGGVMKVAPVGLMYYQNPEMAFKVGAVCTAMTHGSPDAYLPAGFNAALIANVIQGKSLDESVENSIEILKKQKGHENTLKAILKARAFAKTDMDPEEAIAKLGKGWSGPEAMAISLYCVLKEPNDFKKAILMAVNHDGDSDSTGAIVGNILGAYLGMDKIPSDWANNIELSDEIKQLAVDLYNPQEIKNASEKYPIK